MAGAAEKKLAAKASALKTYFLVTLLTLNGLYLVFQHALFSEGPEKAALSNLAIHNGLALPLCYMIISCQQQGVPFDYYFDVLVLNWAVQLFSLYSSNAWYLFGFIPAYVVFQLGKKVATYVFSPREGEAPPDAAEIARMEKKQKKMERKKARQGVYAR